MRKGMCLSTGKEAFNLFFKDLRKKNKNRSLKKKKRICPLTVKDKQKNNTFK